MSIPPLVCCTPPPPDQCEDDKDPEDFDVRYDLSQDDEDDSNNLDFRNFSSYSHFQAHTTTNKTEIASKPLEHEIECENGVTLSNNNKENEKYLGEYDIALENRTRSEEDTNIEDLDLKMDDESIESNLKDNECEMLQNEVDSPVKDNTIDIPDVSREFSHNEKLHSPPSSISENDTIEPDPLSVSEIDIPEDKINGDQCENVAISTGEKNVEMSHNVNEEVQKEINIDEDFGDFDDFQFISPNNRSATAIDTCDNPWDSGEVADSDFGDFTANFDNTESNLQKPDTLVTEQITECNQYQNEASPSSPEDDDFGDFDDFKSSVEVHNTAHTQSELCEQVSVLNLQSSESEVQVMDSINKVMYSIFEHELTEPDSEFDVKLELLLSETWGHLMEADVRQPYIVNWNNSFGQKTLLKALCIDSRNILFAPKWGHNMPKYAANLSTAPLQPLKHQVSSNTSQYESSNIEKTSKSGVWTDPFTADGQESCSTESESAVAETGPTDLDVFEASLSTKPGKIYSSTLSVQPLRQINLPDTHIFTPTDSETPRSKTIHYDSEPTVKISQPTTENQSSQPQTPAIENRDDDDEYWEFHDFKSAPNSNNLSNTSTKVEQPIDKTSETPAPSSDLPKPTITYQTQILQPIKMEPIMPTLNWPDPGEVKEVFDDFSDFVSNSTWSNDNQAPIAQLENNKPNVEYDRPTEQIAEIEIPLQKEVIKTIVNSGDDDGFDTFQSALPTKNVPPDFKPNSLSKDTNNASPQNTTPSTSSIQMAEFEPFEKIRNVKSDTISFANVRPNQALTQTVGFISNKTEPTNKNSSPLGTQFQNNILQPIPANSTSQSQQKTGQILQPLTLESFSQINWPSPGIDLQDLSRFNPVETLQSLKSDLSVAGHNKSSPIHNHKAVNNQATDEDVWGEFVSIKPKPQQPLAKKQPTFADDDEWTDFVSSPSVKPQNGLNTISLNVHTNLNMQKNTNQSKLTSKNNQASLDIPTLNYVTPKANHKTFSDRHFQNL